MNDGKIERQSLDLMLKGYDGTGEYTSKGMSSRFVGMGMDVDGVKAAEGDDEKSEEIIEDSIFGGKVVMMHEAKIEVTKVTDTAIDGTFGWSPSMDRGGHVHRRLSHVRSGRGRDCRDIYRQRWCERCGVCFAAVETRAHWRGAACRTRSMY